MSPPFAWELLVSFFTGITGLMMTDDQQKCTRCLFCAHMIGIQSFWHGSRSMKDFLYCILWFLSIRIHSNSYIESYHHCIVCGFQRWFPGCSRGLWKDAIQRYWFFKDATLSPANDGRLNLTKIFCRKTVTTSHCHSIGQQNLLWKNCCQVAIKLPFLYRFFLSFSKEQTIIINCRLFYTYYLLVAMWREVASIASILGAPVLQSIFLDDVGRDFWATQPLHFRRTWEN